MSEKGASGLSLLEKIVGILIMLIGSILTYQTYINQEAAGLAAWFFMVLGVSIFISGLILLIAKTK
ncbi:TPA: hypothetical protein EYP70_07725 [Candidatus Bathyarchaeota archaeon]|nr:hypothetical protein [Candidatus Bathyarchaeota archaeon]